MERPEISPPPPKRRRVNQPATADNTLNTTEQVISIFSWNVNGIAPFIQPTITSFFKVNSGKDVDRNRPKASLQDFLRRHQWPTFLFLQEVKINPDDSTTIHAVESAVSKQADEGEDVYGYQVHFCLPSDKHNARGFGKKVYGVCSIVRKDFSHQYVDKVRTVKWDAEGRILIIETKAADKLPRLAIINVYAVNGTDHPYKDSATGDVIGTRHDRKLQVHVLLQSECRALEARGFGVILVGDFNIARSTLDGFPNLRTFPKQHCVNRADFEAKFFSHSTEDHDTVEELTTESERNIGLGMIDTFRHLHPHRKSYTYYPRSKPFGESCDRVDMVMISASLKGNIIDAGMHETPIERGPSDHVPLYAVLSFDQNQEDNM